MKVTLRSVLIVFALVSLPLWAQPARTTRPAQTRQQQRDQTTMPPPQVARGVQPHDTWYEFLLKQFNPGQLDYGTWIEQKRRHFLESTLRNPYFNYSCLATMGLLVLAVAYTKKWIDHRRVLLVTSEMMADFYNHDQHSRKAAREAIRRFNSHMEICNRRAEADSRQGTVGDLTSPSLRDELARVTAERDALAGERDTAREELQKKSDLLAEVSVRLQGQSRNGADSKDPKSSTLTNADPTVVAHINKLQEELYAARQEVRRLREA